MDNEYINWDALVNFITGHCSPREEEMIRQWIQMDPKHEEFIVFLRKIWDSSAETKHSWDVESAWSRFTEEYDFPSSGQITSPPQKTTSLSSRQPKKMQHWYSWAAVAAAITITFTALLYLDLLPTTDEDEEIAYREIVTRNGQRTHLNLSDGSSVVLNAGSTLKLPETFDLVTDREVYLSGEAWFEIAHDPDRSFVVYTENTKTQVLGTKFQVTSYPEDEQVQVVVSEGRVSVQDIERNTDNEQTLTANQIAILYEGGLSTVSTVDDLSAYLGWTQGKLVFNEDPLQNVALKLRRWYDIDIQFDTDLSVYSTRQLTATFSENQSVQEVIEAIALTMDIDYKKQENGTGYTFF